jgi:acetoin utilization protein AcuC
VVPRSWTHLLAALVEAELAPTTAVPADWSAYAATVARGAALPVVMTDGAEPQWTAWDGTGDTALDRAIQETRRAVYPLHDLDPEDPRL